MTSNTHLSTMADSTDVSEYDSDSEKGAMPMVTYLDEMYSRTKEISTLVSMARMQAREAEIRARYAIEFAKKAAAESLAANQVCETLSQTARVVFALSREFFDRREIDDTETCSDSISDVSDNEESFDLTDVMIPAAEDVPVADGLTVADKQVPMESGTGSKYDATFPEDVTPGNCKPVCSDMESMPTLWEMSGKCPLPSDDIVTSNTNDADDCDATNEPDDVANEPNLPVEVNSEPDLLIYVKSEPDLPEQIRQLEIQRKMNRYKLIGERKKSGGRKSGGKGDAKDVSLTFQESGTQTNSMQA